MRKRTFILWFLSLLYSCSSPKTRPGGDAGTPPVIDAASPSDGTKHVDPDAKTDANIPNYEGDCEATAGFCWLNAVPTGADLHAIHGTSETDIWAVGRGGVIVRWDGAAFRPVVSPVQYTLQDVHAVTPDDVWAVGLVGTVLHFDGSDWRSVPFPTDEDLNGVHALSATSVWVAGRTKIWHFDGENWEVSSNYDWAVGGLSVAATSDSDVWVGTSYGNLLHFDGQKWDYSGAYFSLNAEVTSIWADSPDNVWVSAPGGDTQYWNGSEWNYVPWDAGKTPVETGGLHGTSPSNVWFASGLGIYHFDGENYQHFKATEGMDPKGVFCAGERAWIVGIAGMTYIAEASGVELIGGSARGDGIYARWFSTLAFAADDAWFFGLGKAMYFDGSSFQEVSTVDTRYRQDFSGSWANSPNDFWIGGVGTSGDSIQHWDGTAFVRPKYADNIGDTSWILDIWGTASDNVYFAGLRGVLHYDGTQINATSVKRNTSDVDGTGPNDIWAATDGAVLRWDGNGWIDTEAGDAWWMSVHAITPNDVWASSEGYASHWNGDTWTHMVLPQSDNTRRDAISAFVDFGTDDIWAIAGDAILHWNGKEWSVATRTGANYLAAMSIAPDGSVFITGGNDAVLRRRF